MVLENQFINSIKLRRDLTPREEWEWRSHYRSLPKSVLKKADQAYVHKKNKLSFSEWFELISENIEEGHLIQELNQDNIRRGTRWDKHRRLLDDNEHREYLSLPELSEEDIEKNKKRFEENLDGKYEYPEFISEPVEEMELVNKEEE